MSEYTKKISPLGDRVVIKRFEDENKTSGGILLTSSATEKSSKGVVIAKGGKCTLDLFVDDVVLFGQYSGNIIKLDGGEFIIMKESEVFAILDDEI